MKTILIIKIDLIPINILATLKRIYYKTHLPTLFHQVNDENDGHFMLTLEAFLFHPTIELPVECFLVNATRQHMKVNKQTQCSY